MIRIGIIGDIGSGKSYVAKQFGFPVFDADIEVNKIYKKNRKCFKKLKKTCPKHIFSFPIKRKELSQAVAKDKNNVKKIIGLEPSVNMQKLSKRRLKDFNINFECVSPGEVKFLIKTFPNISLNRILFTPIFLQKTNIFGQ